MRLLCLLLIKELIVLLASFLKQSCRTLMKNIALLYEQCSQDSFSLFSLFFIPAELLLFTLYNQPLSPFGHSPCRIEEKLIHFRLEQTTLPIL